MGLHFNKTSVHAVATGRDVRVMMDARKRSGREGDSADRGCALEETLGMRTNDITEKETEASLAGGEGHIGKLAGKLR